MAIRTSSGQLVINLLSDQIELKKSEEKKFKLPTSKQPEWRYPTVIENQYYRDIQRILRRFTVPTMAQIKDDLPEWIAQREAIEESRKDSAADDMQAITNSLRETQKEIFVDGEQQLKILLLGYGISVSNFNKKQWAKQINWALRGKFNVNLLQDEPYLDDVIRSWSNTNYELIKGLSDEYIKSINLSVSQGLANGSSARAITKDLLRIGSNLTHPRAKLIAVDQIGKLNGFLTQERQKDAGVDEYIWSTSQDERVVGNPSGLYPRPTSAHGDHYKMDRSINKWDNRNVYSKDGGKTFINRPTSTQGAIPGSQIRCRCSALSNWEKAIEDIEGD